MAEKETMLGGLRRVRERTLAFISETERRDLSTLLAASISGDVKHL
jgi:hypothetical protein